MLCVEETITRYVRLYCPAGIKSTQSYNHSHIQRCPKVEKSSENIFSNLIDFFFIANDMLSIILTMGVKR